MENIEKKNKLVSIIVPVYNSEKYLGYCLNSIVSQTYRNIEIILINDGSIDDSLSICENYAEIDERISVTSIRNNGVSNARNVGLDIATGEYIQFVDSDDVIKPNMIEELVQLIEMYETDIVVCGFEMIEFKKDISNKKTFIFTSNIMGNECVLTREMFFNKMAFILWRTSYLESPWNKLFRKSIIRENHIYFPKEISLGEDFCFNIEYFNNIQSIVFTASRYYYHLGQNPNALTKIYRPDMFENQLFLIKKFYNLLNKNIQISKLEEIELAEYIIAKAMQSLYCLVDEKCKLSIPEIKKEIAKIINSDYVRHAYKIAKYIEPRYEWIRECMEFSDVQKVYDFLFCSTIPILEPTEPITPVPERRIYRKPWWLKQFLIDICDAILKIHYIEFIEQIRNSLQIRSIKKTVKKGLLKLIGKSEEYDKVL